MRSLPVCVLALCLFLASVLLLADAPSASAIVAAPPPPPPVSGIVTVDARAGSLANTFIPNRTIGAGVDGVAAGAVPRIYTPSNVKQMLTAGDGPVSYRLYTELSVQQWHWNPVGTWSDPKDQSGYFTGAVDSKDDVIDTYGYRLPHRGGTHDQGNNDDYSRLDDGDAGTYWKSNPYLTSAYTKESDALHPQWIIVDLGSVQPVDAVQIQWGNPYATDFQVQYATSRDNPVDDPSHAVWATFPSGAATGATGGAMTLQVAPAPVNARYVRVWMTASSGTYSDESSTDPRSRMGYAVYEVRVGTVDAGQKFTDLVTHLPSDKQSEAYCSSTDPWHTAADRCRNQEQPGLDAVYRSGLTRGLPAMVPVGVVYDTPEDAVAELEFARKRGYGIGYVEMGEEADEEWMSPEDYGSLYIQWATAIHTRFPKLLIGGPVMANHAFTASWANAAGVTDWLGRFYAYLQQHGHAQDLAFYSFEFYPQARDGFYGRGLFESIDAVHQIFDQKRFSKIPDSVPAFLTEYNLGETQQQPVLYGAVWHADFLADFLTSGGKGIYFYEYEPLPFEVHEQEGGSFSLFSSGPDNKIRQPLSQYFSSRLTNLYWLDGRHADQAHQLYPASSTIPPAPGGGNPLTAYAVHRPDGQWSVMLINKDPSRIYNVAVQFRAEGGGQLAFTGRVRRAQFGPVQYTFHENGQGSTAQPDGPEAVDSVKAVAGTIYSLPAESITVLTGKAYSKPRDGA